MNTDILVIGGTGKTGRRVVEHLQKKGLTPRIGSRQAAVPFDWNRKETWIQALEGIDKIYMTYFPDLAVPGAKTAIESLTYLAKELGVKKIVLLSGKGESEAEACETIIINSGINHTIVRASWFHQNWSESFFLEPILSGEIALPMSDIPIPFVDADDIAEVATAALLTDHLNGAIVEVTGPELITFKDAVQIIANASNRILKFQEISLAAYVEGMQQQNIPNDVIWLMDYLFSHVLTNPLNQKLTNGVETVLGRAPKSFKAYAETTAKTGIWNPKAS